MKKDLISVGMLTGAEVRALFALTDKLKRTPKLFARALAGKTIALIFQKPSNRTRVSFEVGMTQLGGAAIYLSPAEINLGVRESVKDVARTLSRYVDGIVIRTFGHGNVLELAEHATVPVINGLSDFSHPCQALADVYTLREKRGRLKGLTLAYVGDGNNVCNSLLYTCAKAGVNIRVATPKGFEPDGGVVEASIETARMAGSLVELFYDPREAVRNADVIYTDVWTSMGQEAEARKRRRIFAKFQVNSSLLNLASKDVMVMHCLPAHRDEEITDEVMEGRHSVVFDEAENRLHVQKAVLLTLLGEKK
jgi:ornithine carbamoyltransferase